MSIEKDVKSVMAFVKKNEKLIDELRDAGAATQDEIEKLAKRYERNRKEIEELAASLGSTKFKVGRTDATLEQQAVLIDEIALYSRNISIFRDHPVLRAHYLAQRGRCYTALAGTFSNMAARMIDFTNEEVEELEVLLNRAVLDTEKRKKVAFVVDATIQLTKIAMKIAKKIVAI